MYKLRASPLAGLLALLVPVAGHAAVRPAANSTGSAVVLRPLSVVKNQDMDFGRLVAGGAGTAVINPVSGTLSVTGGVSPVAPESHPAVFTGAGTKNAVAIIRIPTNPITLTRVGGTETMTVSTWTLDGPAARRIAANRAFTFAVGATLAVNAGQTDGTYVGSFDVTVQYP
jgi:hypothetical protein